MLQFIGCCCSESNVAHKVQRYIKLFVASELVSDVLGVYPWRNSCSQYEQEADLPATNLGFLSTASCRVSSGIPSRGRKPERKASLSDLCGLSECTERARGKACVSRRGTELFYHEGHEEHEGVKSNAHRVTPIILYPAPGAL